MLPRRRMDVSHTSGEEGFILNNLLILGFNNTTK